MEIVHHRVNGVAVGAKREKLRADLASHPFNRIPARAGGADRA